MIVSSTEIQNNFGKYLIMAGKEDIIITKNGTEVARLTAGDNIINQKKTMDSVIKEEAEDYYTQEDDFYGRKATYKEFLRLAKDNEDSRYEYIDGEIFVLASPKTPHQTALMELIGSFYNWFQGKKCRPMIAPYDITLKKSKNNINVVQPDLMVICDLEEKLGADGYYKGVPSLVLEVLSQNTASKDLLKKANLYMNTGVQEYWMVDPFYKSILIYLFTDYRRSNVRLYEEGSGVAAESFIFEGFSIVLDKVFR
ncbi:MAG: type II toxin-antitoxin system Phd/YefM family antitoxin [Ruminiclostridium sp.]|nr:type II toxin-antitoxin system Phd/YefM family antitoxin [Ruminiclostridium sp.]